MIPQVYRDMDILESLGRIVDQHTKEFKEDFELDKKIILKMAQSPDENDHHLIWMCRPLGTHCFAEWDVFLENTFENRGLYAYHSEKPNKNLLYALHLKRNDGETVRKISLDGMGRRQRKYVLSYEKNNQWQRGGKSGLLYQLNRIDKKQQRPQDGCHYSDAKDWHVEF